MPTKGKESNITYEKTTNENMKEASEAGEDRDF
jgi:hypothetical protein